MIDRLGCLGDASIDKDAVYRDLLKPLTSGGWDISRLRTSNGIASKLHNRLTAYVRLNALSTLVHESSSFSTTFLRWLAAHCSQSLVSKASEQKSPLTNDVFVDSQPSLRTALCASATFNMDPPVLSTEAWGSPPDDTQFASWTPLSIHQVGSVTEHNTVEAKLTSAITSSDRITSRTEASQLLDVSQLLHTPSTLRWTALLPLPMDVPEIWAKLFQATQDANVNTHLDTLAKKCAVYWDREQIQSCLSWIYSFVPGREQLSLDRIQCFVAANLCCETWRSTPLSFSSKVAEASTSNAGRQQPGISNVILHTALMAASDENVWRLRLPRQVATCSLVVGQEVAAHIMEQLADAKGMQYRILVGLLLRLYIFCPSWVPADVPSVRKHLLCATEAYPEFVRWSLRTTDFALDNSLRSIFGRDDSARSSRGLMEASRGHPLQVVNKLTRVVQSLKVDAGEYALHPVPAERIQGEGLQGAHEAIYEGRPVLVHTRHWGYAYTEPAWLCVLDCLLNMSSIVLFTCGTSGVLELLAVYLQLLSVQMRLRTPVRAERLKTKLAELLLNFKNTSPIHWKTWLNSTLEGSEIRHVLLSLELLSPQDGLVLHQANGTDGIS